MKKLVIAVLFTGLMSGFLLTSCTSVNLTSWKDQSTNTQVNEVVIMALFDRMDVTKSIEENMCSYFTAKNLKCIKSLDFIPPNQQLTESELKEKLIGTGADAVLIFIPKQADKSVNYVPPTYSGYYRGWYGGMYTVSPGYYSESTTYRVQANLYTKEDKGLIWSGDISTTDPSTIDAAAMQMASAVYKDWVKNGIVVALK